MNLQRILERVAAQCDLDALSEEERMLAVDYINEGQEDLMGIYRPYVRLEVSVPDDCIILQSSMGEYAGHVLRIYNRHGSLPFDRREDGSLLVAAVPGTTVWLRCRYRCLRLMQDGDVPDLPAKSGGALADYATWRLMQNGGRARQQRGEVYYGRYLQHRANLGADSLESREVIVNKYA